MNNDFKEAEEWHKSVSVEDEAESLRTDGCSIVMNPQDLLINQTLVDSTAAHSPMEAKATVARLLSLHFTEDKPTYTPVSHTLEETRVDSTTRTFECLKTRNASCLRLIEAKSRSSKTLWLTLVYHSSQMKDQFSAKTALCKLSLLWSLVQRNRSFLAA